MDFNKKTFWIVFTLIVSIITGIAFFVIFKLYTLEEYLKDYAYQNKEYLKSYTQNLESINNSLVKINNYFEINKVTKN